MAFNIHIVHSSLIFDLQFSLSVVILALNIPFLHFIYAYNFHLTFIISEFDIPLLPNL